jgi:hypothetical protein
MATANEATDIAVLKTEVKTIKEVLVRVESKIDAQTDLYVTRTEFNEFKQRWILSHTLAAVTGSIITGLVIYFLTHHS